MADVVGEIIAYGALPVALVVGALVLHWLRGASSVTRWAAALLLAAATFVVLAGFGIGVSFRDGLGPDAQASAGLSALRRSLNVVDGAALLAGACLAAPGVILAWLARRRRPPASDVVG